MDSFTANNKEQLVCLSAGALRRAKPSVGGGLLGTEGILDLHFSHIHLVRE